MAIAITDIATQVIKQVQSPAALTGSTTSAAADLTDAVGPVTLLLSIGAVTGTTPAAAVKVQHSPDNVTFTDTPEGTLATLTAADANTARAFVLPQTIYPYIKVVETISGTTPSFTLGALLLAQKHISGTGGQGYSNAPTSAY